MKPPSRRRLIAAAPALLLAGCKGPEAAAAPPVSLPPLRQVAPFPLGACAMTGEFGDPDFVRLLTANFSQITPEWEMKMEAIVRDDGGFDYGRSDAVADFAAQHGLRLHGHTLIWHEEHPAAFERIGGSGQPFADAYRTYILGVAGRYRGRVVGWDVVNEPVAEDGNGYRECLWRANLGMDYVPLAFHHAREADPTVPLFLNDYNLESLPAKRASFMRLAESLLKADAPLSGLGTQTHLDTTLQPGAIKAAIRELASLGLPIHVSELDVSTHLGRLDMTPTAERLQRQARLVGEAAEAFMALPAQQRYALTIWGVRDKDSFLRHASYSDASDSPVLFDDAGRPKPAARALVNAVSRG